MTELSIIMYHYVRDLERTRYPALKGRQLSEFVCQLDYLECAHTIVSAEQVMAAVLGETELPSDAAWLTFDDAYLDHYTNVFPLLHERGWQGSFFPPVASVLDGELLDFHKVHFVLASQLDWDPIIDHIRKFVADRNQKAAAACAARG